jgi:hypothetical protein
MGQKKRVGSGEQRTDDKVHVVQKEWRGLHLIWQEGPDETPKLRRLLLSEDRLPIREERGHVEVP